MDSNKRIEEKLDKVVDKISNIDATLAGQAVELKEHIRRTSILEDKITPIEKHVNMINGVLKFIGLIGIFMGILEAFLKIMGY